MQKKKAKPLILEYLKPANVVKQGFISISPQFLLMRPKIRDQKFLNSTSFGTGVFFQNLVRVKFKIEAVTLESFMVKNILEYNNGENFNKVWISGGDFRGTFL